MTSTGCEPATICIAAYRSSPHHSLRYGKSLYIVNLTNWFLWTMSDKKSLMAKWLEQASQWHDIYSHDLEVMSLKPGRVELGVLGTSVLSHTWIKIKLVLSYLILDSSTTLCRQQVEENVYFYSPWLVSSHFLCSHIAVEFGLSCTSQPSAGRWLSLSTHSTWRTCCPCPQLAEHYNMTRWRSLMSGKK